MKNLIHITVGNNNVSGYAMSELFSLLDRNEILISLDTSNVDGYNRNRVNLDSMRILKNNLLKNETL